MPDIIQQLLDLKEWSQNPERYERRLNFRGAGLVQPGPGRQGYADDHLDKANLVRKQDAIKNLNEKWTAERVEKAAKKIYPDEELDAILNDIVKRRQINKHLTEYGEGLVQSEARIEGRKKRTITLKDRDIVDIRKNLLKHNKKVAMVNNQFVFADPKLQEAFIDDMVLRYRHPKTSTKARQAGVLSNEQIFKKYFEGTYSEKGVHDLINRFKTELGLEFKKLPPGERNVDQLRRQAKLLISQAGTRISGLEAFPAHHLYPIGDEFAHGTQDFAVIDKKTNSQLSGPNKKLVYLAEDRTQLVNDVSSGKISVAEFDNASAKLDAQADSIINNHYKKYPKHDGLLNWRKAGLILDDQGRYMDITVKETLGGNAKKWSLTNLDKSIKKLTDTELATFKSTIKETALEKVPKATKVTIPAGSSRVSSVAGVFDDALKTKTAKNIGRIVSKFGKKGARFLASDWVWPEVAIAWAEYKNRKQKGQSTERARSETLKMATLGLYDQQGTEKAILEQAKMLGYEEDDIRALDNFIKINKLDEEIQKKLRLIDAMELGAVEQGVYGKAEEMEKVQIGAEGGAQALRDEVAEMKKTKESLTGFYFGALGDKDASYGAEVFSKSLKSLSDTEFNVSLEDRMKQADPYAGGIGSWLNTNVFTLSPQEGKALQERINAMNPQELREFNIERGVLPIGPTYDAYDPRKMEGLYETMGYMYPKAKGGRVSYFDGGLASLLKKK